jgi:outer membrane protein assembly factor BamB
VSPSIDAQGRIYIASDAGTLYRLESDGTVDWEIELPGAAVTSASIFDGPTGLTVLVGTANDSVQCISNGQIQSTALISGHPVADIALDATGAAYVGTSTGRLTTINSDCTVLRNQPNLFCA